MSEEKVESAQKRQNQNQNQTSTHQNGAAMQKGKKKQQHFNEKKVQYLNKNS